MVTREVLSVPSCTAGRAGSAAAVRLAGDPVEAQELSPQCSSIAPIRPVIKKTYARAPPPASTVGIGGNIMIFSQIPRAQRLSLQLPRQITQPRHMSGKTKSTIATEAGIDAAS